MKIEILVVMLLLLCACRGPKGDAGRDGSAGNPGSNARLPGPVSNVPFTLSGTILFPTGQVIVNVPDLNLERGDVINVYLRWHNQEEVWSQIGATWVGGMAGSYFVIGTTVTINVVTGLDTDWLISGVHKG